MNLNFKVIKSKGYTTYKQYLENQAKILKITLSNKYERVIKELKFSNHSLKKEKRESDLKIKSTIQLLTN